MLKCLELLKGETSFYIVVHWKELLSNFKWLYRYLELIWELKFSWHSIWLLLFSSFILYNKMIIYLSYFPSDIVKNKSWPSPLMYLSQFGQIKFRTVRYVHAIWHVIQYGAVTELFNSMKCERVLLTYSERPELESKVYLLNPLWVL